MSSSKKLLVVVDMQNDFLTGVLGSAEAEAIIQNVAEFVKNYKGDIVFTQDTHNAGENTVEASRIPEHCIQGTHGWDIEPSIIKAFNENKYANRNSNFGDPADNVYIKPTFGSAELYEDLMYNFQYDEIEFIGVCTDICVISNALVARAARPDAIIKVHSGLCAGTSSAKHEAALSVMESCLIDVV